MNEVACPVSSLNPVYSSDSFHVKGDYIASLLKKYKIQTLEELDEKIETDAKYRVILRFIIFININYIIIYNKL